jgi:O-antigen/teichoic acid export membrane protein
MTIAEQKLSPMSNIPAPIGEHERTEYKASLWGRIRGRSTAVFGMTARKFSVSLVDQIVVSGTNFITTVLVGRKGGPEELANYALGFTLVIIIFSVLETLIAMPYTIYANRLEGAARAGYRGAVLVQCGLLSALAALVLAGWGMVISIGVGTQGLALVLYVLSAAIPFYILREFSRQSSFAHLNSITALRLDLCAGTLQIVCIAALAAGELLSAITVYATIGVANAVVALTWLSRSRNDFVVQRSQIFPVIRRNLSFGGWILAGRIVVLLNSDILVLWLMAFVLGNKATGIFAACMTVVHLSNPFVIGMGQVLTPRVAQAFTDNGLREVQRVARKATLFMGLALSGFCIGAFLFGDEALRIFYGSQYDGNSHTITVLSVSILASALSMPAASSLLVLERPDVSLKASATGLLITMTVASALVFPLGVLGVAWGLLCGQIGASAVRWIVFRRMAVKRPPGRDQRIHVNGVGP